MLVTDAMRRRRRVLVWIGLALVGLVALERCERLEMRTALPSVAPAAQASEHATERAADGLPILTVAVLPGPGEDAYAAVLSRLPGLRAVLRADEAVVLLDPVSRNALDASYDVVAEVPDPDRDLPRVLSAARVIESVRRLALAGGPKVDFSSFDEVQPSGAHLEFDIVAGPGHLTVFALSAAGVVEPLWPLTPDDVDPWPGDRPFRIAVTVSPPFGADTLVAVHGAADPAELRARLAADDRTPEAVHAAVVDLVGRSATVGTRTFFTGDAPEGK